MRPVVFVRGQLGGRHSTTAMERRHSPESGDRVAVPVRLVCQALGLDVGSQSERLQSHDVLSMGLRIVRIRQGNQLRPVVALLHRYIPFWLATISPKEVKPEVRPKPVRYQTELVDVLAALYGNDLRVI